MTYATTGTETVVPNDWPVQPVDGNTYKGSDRWLDAVGEFGSRAAAIDAGYRPPDIATCWGCLRQWDDSLVSDMTPTPSGRCPFESFHDH